MGYVLNTGPELEFFLLRRSAEGVEPLPHDAAGYFDLSEDLGTEVRKEMMNDLEAHGIKVETAHHEVATGQHEIDFEYADALRTADNAVTFKTTLKAVAARHGLYATFMPKPFFGMNGNGMHTHQSLWDVKKGRNAFADEKDEYGLSPTARSYIAGILEHARGMIAVLAPLVNSYKRLVPGYEAPVYIGWARINRSALIRIPQISHGQLNSTRIELRCPDPSSNPYLSFAAMLAAGLDGIDRKLTPPEPVEENLYHFDAAKLASRKIRQLPGTLREALDELQADRVIADALGEHVFELRGGEGRGVGRVPDAGHQLGGRALPRGLLSRWRDACCRSPTAGRQLPPR
jgi:glutamine synthetase